jgi:(S)-ureidoglycine aminohydrolase
MNTMFGCTRTVVQERYALITPDGYGVSHLPGWKNAACVVNISPALGGPRFTQLHITLDKEGTGEGNTGVNQYFIYVVEGAGTIDLVEKRHRLERGSYIYLPPGKDLVLKNTHATPMKLLVFQKRYLALKGGAALASIVGHEREVKSQPCLGLEEVRLQALLPEQPAFDLAVNIVTHQPGAALPTVATHIMEHGGLMLKGQGLWRLDAEYRPAQTGDAFWLAAYCPHWFVGWAKLRPATFATRT